MKKDQKDFLKALLECHCPSGYEGSVREVFKKRVEKSADSIEVDTMGNCMAILNPKGSPTIMLAGHTDEIGLQVTHIDDNGFISFGTIGGHDRGLIPGRRVLVHSEKGPVSGVTGKMAIHLMTDADKKRIPEVFEMWIDIGAKDKAEAEELVSIGDAVTYDMGYQELRNDLAASRAFDDRTGVYVAAETFLALAKGKKPKAKVVAVATVQEEIGTRGAITSTYGVDPDIGVCIDVCHATDSPGMDLRKTGLTKLGGGPRLARGASVSPYIFDLLKGAAEKTKTPYQLGAVPGQAPNDARSIQLARSGVATGTVGLPLRYMHTPSEVISLKDLDHSVTILEEFCRSVDGKTRYRPE
ncbi:MAG: M42 family metallopeptidase [Candidatus Omnitrophica bacterium]|nr:M42 family metallopeptidase [Candidatus Omnitrophota bacterium]